MNHDKWDFKEVATKAWETRHGLVKIHVTWSKIPGRKKYFGIGVDPGRNFSVVTLDGKEAWLFYGTLQKVDKRRKYEYGLAAYDALSEKTNYYGTGPAVVEGAAHKMPHGQADLAHVRMGFVIGLSSAGFEVRLGPPSTIRKHACGRGNLAGLEVWPELNHNAADALAAALYAAGLRQGDISGTHLRS